MKIDFSDSYIVEDEMAKIFKNFRPPSISDVYKRITEKYEMAKNVNNDISIQVLDLSLNNFNANTILKYCLANEHGYFSINEFEYLDLSKTNVNIYEEDDEDEYMNLIWELLIKYKNLTINLSYTKFDYPRHKKRCIQDNPYDIYISDRLILDNSSKIEHREYVRKQHCYHCKCEYCIGKNYNIY
jgi:hypothetical protein